MNNDTILIAVIVALLLVVAFQSLQLISIRNEIRGTNAGNTGNFQGYSSYEEMMEAHHGSGDDLPAQQGGC